MTLLVLLGPDTRAQAQRPDDVTWLLNQINALRADLGLHPYALNPQLSTAAQLHSQYMSDTCDVSHTQANGSRPIDRARAQGYTGGWISENIYSGATPNASAAWDFWINSPLHYQGLTHKIVNEIGIGAAHGACGWYSYTLLFGHRDDVTAPPAPAPPAGGDSSAPPPPTARPYVPPPPTSTPTPTIATLTPSPTWTLTPTWTPSRTPSPRPPSATPRALDTAPPTHTAAAVAMAASPRATSSPSDVTPVAATATVTEAVTATRPAATQVALGPPAVAQAVTRTPVPPGDPSGEAGSLDLRDLLPYALLGQALLLGGAGVWMFQRSE